MHERPHRVPAQQQEAVRVRQPVPQSFQGNRPVHMAGSTQRIDHFAEHSYGRSRDPLGMLAKQPAHGSALPLGVRQGSVHERGEQLVRVDERQLAA